LTFFVTQKRGNSLRSIWPLDTIENLVHVLYMSNKPYIYRLREKDVIKQLA